MDFLERLIDHIEASIEMHAPFSVGRLAATKSAAAIRQTPSGISGRYYSKGKTQDFSFQILIKDPNQLRVINLLQTITDGLDGLDNGSIPSSNASYAFIKCEVDVYPNYVEETDHKEYIYTALFTAELEGGK